MLSVAAGVADEERMMLDSLVDDKATADYSSIKRATMAMIDSSSVHQAKMATWKIVVNVWLVNPVNKGAQLQTVSSDQHGN
jgi:hypothetical protein